MGETKKIVVENYPLDKLPADLRALLEGGNPVRVVLEQMPDTQSIPAKKKFSDFIGSAPGRYKSADEIVAEVRALRDEWEDRG